LAWYRQQPGDVSRREVERLTQALAAHWISEADDYRKQYRYRAVIGALREAVRVSDSPAIRDGLRKAVALQDRLDDDMSQSIQLIELRRFEQAISVLTGILSVKPDHAKAHGRLGTCYAITGQKEQAAEHLLAAAREDPDDSYGLAMLGWLAYLDHRPED